MLRCTPILLFDGTCAEAMTFYHQCLGGDLTLTRLGDTPMKVHFPEEKHNRIINPLLIGGSMEISAPDWMDSPSFDPIKRIYMPFLLLLKDSRNRKQYLTNWLKEQKTRGFRNCTKCHSGCKDSFMISMVFSGSLKGDKKE